MSAAHDSHDHAPEQPEVSHPLLWSLLILGIATFLAWLFFFYLFKGMHVARHHHKIHVGHVGEVEPDHKALMANRSADVIDRGAAVYNAKCASCHGAQGNSNPSNMKPAPRNFHVDAWKNANGGGPYALYLVLKNGMGTMPAFPGLTADDKYAVNHFIAESWVKKVNSAHYVELDSKEVQSTIPAAGEAGGHGKEHNPTQVEVKAPVRPLMAGIVQQENRRVNTVQVWAEAASSSATSEYKQAAQSFVDLVKQQPGLALAIKETVAANDKDRFTVLLAGSDGSGAVRSNFSLLSADELNGLFALLKGGK